MELSFCSNDFLKKCDSMGARRPKFKFWLHRLLAAWPCKSYFLGLCLDLFTCELGLVHTLQDGFKKEVRTFCGVGYLTYRKHFVYYCHCIALLCKTFNEFTFIRRHSIVIFTARPLSSFPVSIPGSYAAATLDSQVDLPRSLGIPGSLGMSSFLFLSLKKSESFISSLIQFIFSMKFL